MINIFKITKNHLTAAKEHIKRENISHTPTLFQALRITLFDLFHNKTIYHKETNSHLVYEIVKVPTLGIRVANVIKIFVPKEHRGQGVASLMLDEIKENTVISGKGKYGEVGRLYLSRTNI